MSVVKGRSEFTISTRFTAEEIVATMNQVLESYLVVPSLLEARAMALSPDQFEIVTRFASSSFAEAEEVLGHIAASLQTALAGQAAVPRHGRPDTSEPAVEQGITELVSA